MRLRVRHKIHQRFESPARNVTRVLRLTPRSHDGQHVIKWRLDVDTDCVLKAGQDGFGNTTHTFTAKGPLDALTIAVSGEIDTFDAVGVVRNAVERMPLELYLRETAFTTADTAVRALAQEADRAETARLGKLHALKTMLHEAVAATGETADDAPAAQVLAAKSGSAAGIAHLFIAGARSIGIPARATSGFYLCDDKRRGMRHVWTEAFVEGLGWTGFDVVHDLCPQESHIRLATGLDAMETASVRGVGGEPAVEETEVSAPFDLGWSQGQWQRQGGGLQSQGQGGQSQRQG